MHSIYRLEYPNSFGVYYGSASYDEANLVLQLHRVHHENWPAPEEDGMGRSHWLDMIFGFSSLEQMRQWFDGPERLYLSTFGIALSHYQARGPIVSGRCQVAFYRQSAELIWQRPLNHF